MLLQHPHSLRCPITPRRRSPTSSRPSAASTNAVPTAAAKRDAEITQRVERLAAQEFEGPVLRLRSGAVVRSWSVPPFRIYYQRHTEDLLIVRVYHHARRPITR